MEVDREGHVWTGGGRVVTVVDVVTRTVGATKPTDIQILYLVGETDEGLTQGPDVIGRRHETNVELK